MRGRAFFTAVLGALALAPAPQGAARADDAAQCADERVKTAVAPLSVLVAGQSACSRLLAAARTEAERQKALFYRSLFKFLAVVQENAARAGEVASGERKPQDFAPLTEADLGPAREDAEAAIALEGPLKGEALALRATMDQTLGRKARQDIAAAMLEAPQSATPYVQRALERENAGDAQGALADLDRALELDSRSGVALFARGALARRLGRLERARADLAAAAALGPPYRRIALETRAQVELRAGDLRAAFDSLLAAARATGDMPKDEAAAARARLLVDAGDLALDKLKDAATAQKMFAAAAALAPQDPAAALGLARAAESRGERARAIAILKRVLAETANRPELLERLLAERRLRQLTAPPRERHGALFRSGFDAGLAPPAPSPDGLRRVAFLIGSGKYSELAGLPNATRDVAVVAHALSQLGFTTVEVAEDPGGADLRRAVATIGEAAAQADVALVFYAGHGVEIDGVNYLVPVDAKLESDASLPTEALRLADLTAAAARARRGALVMVDACRDDPFAEARGVAASRGAAAGTKRAAGGLRSGLAPSRIAPNAVVLHSTQAGQAALDGDGLDSPFVRSLLEALYAPGRSLDDIVRETTEKVVQRTGGRQKPAAYGAPPSAALLPERKPL